jgi:hypothetical protein
VWHPVDSLQGYYTATRGQSEITHAPVPSRAAPGSPCGRAAPDRRDATPVPVFKIVGDTDGMVRSLAKVDRLGSCRHESGARRPDRQPIRGPDRRTPSPTSIGTSTATDNHGHPRTRTRGSGPVHGHIAGSGWCCLRLRNRRLRRRPQSSPNVTFASRGGIVVSSLVSSVHVRLRSLVFGLMQRCRSRTLTVFGELLSRLLKIGRLPTAADGTASGSGPTLWVRDAIRAGVGRD